MIFAGRRAQSLRERFERQMRKKDVPKDGADQRARRSRRAKRRDFSERRGAISASEEATGGRERWRARRGGEMGREVGEREAGRGRARLTGDDSA
jgi:hypothetical protein